MIEQPHSWRDQFVKSMVWWEAREKPGSNMRDFVRASCDSLENVIKDFQLRDSDGVDVPQEEQELFMAGFRTFVRETIIGKLMDLEAVWSRTESPIERAMVAALSTVARHYASSVGFRLTGHEQKQFRIGDRQTDNDITIEPQAQLGEHRVDFLVTYTGHDYVGDESAPRGIANLEAHRQLIVECDGHDFHDRSKEQAKRDRERDRWLQSLGYKVFRYTGSEIWADVFKAADEALEVVMFPKGLYPEEPDS